MSIQKLRDGSEGLLSKILIGLIIVVFGLFGFGSITTFLAPVPKVATVNGEDVTQLEMEVAVDRSRRMLQAQQQQVNEDELRAQVLQNLINRKLMLQAADDLNLAASESIIDEEILRTEMFQIDGVFNPQQFQMVLGGAGYTPVTYRNELASDLRLQQMMAGLQATSFITQDDAVRAQSLAQQRRDIAVLRMSAEALSADVAVTAEEVEDYYDMNTGIFMTEETVDIEYVELKRSDFEAEVEVSDEALMGFYEEVKDRYAEDERRRIAHILVETNDDVSDDDARARIDDIYGRILDGESFEALAEAESDDPGSASAGGDLGFNGRGVFVEEFENVAWTLDRNQMSEPVQTEFGFHIIKLLDLEAARVPEFAEVRAGIEQEYREVEAEGIFVEQSALLSEIAFEALDLEEPANELGIEARSTGPVGRSVTEGIASNAEVLEAAFGADVLIDGNNSRLIEITPNHHVVVRVAQHSPSAVKPLEDVSEEVESELRRSKAVELAASQAEEAFEMLREGSITRFVADQYGLEWQVFEDIDRNGVGLDREVSVEAFGLPRPPEDEKSLGWAQLSNGDSVVVTVTRVQNFATFEDMGLENISGFQRILASQQGGYEYSEFREGLRSKAEINRVN